ncbi:hypothetical protein PIB30_066873, partial [Stylosanthes scabra]|nr:hypothetical protein [Stylosanthes scabra]
RAKKRIGKLSNGSPLALFIHIYTHSSFLPNRNNSFTGGRLLRDRCLHHSKWSVQLLLNASITVNFSSLS